MKINNKMHIRKKGPGAGKPRRNPKMGRAETDMMASPFTEALGWRKGQRLTKLGKQVAKQVDNQYTPTDKMQADFLFKDHSGRGITSKLSEQHIRTTWNLADVDGSGRTLADFLDNSQMGETWTNEDDMAELVRLKDNVGFFRVFNKTDQIYASPQIFPTKGAAQEFIKRFRERFKSQGYYKTASGERISPEQVQLAIIPDGGINANR